MTVDDIEDPDLGVKVQAWKLVTQDNLPQREVATRLGISAATVNRYVAQGRMAETYVVAFAKADLRRDVAYTLKEMILAWRGDMAVQDDVKIKLAISEHIAKLFAQLCLLLGLNEPTRVAVGQDSGEPKTPDPAMVRAIEEAQRDNQDYLHRLRAGQPGREEEEETA